MKPSNCCTASAGAHERGRGLPRRDSGRDAGRRPARRALHTSFDPTRGRSGRDAVGRAVDRAGGRDQSGPARRLCRSGRGGAGLSALEAAGSSDPGGTAGGGCRRRAAPGQGRDPAPSWTRGGDAAPSGGGPRRRGAVAASRAWRGISDGAAGYRRRDRGRGGGSERHARLHVARDRPGAGADARPGGRGPRLRRFGRPRSETGPGGGESRGAASDGAADRPEELGRADGDRPGRGRAGGGGADEGRTGRVRA